MARAFDVGLLLHLVNTYDWDRYEAGAFDRPALVADADVLEQAKRFLLQAEPMGFDSLWITEHHRTPYGMCPNPLQFLAYFAGRTQRIALGTAVVVVPWHDPLRIAEDIALLDTLAGDRRLLIGFGRGAAASEYEHLRIDQSTSRERFNEGVEIIRRALTQEEFNYDGKIFQIPKTTLRPRPKHPELVDDFYCAFVGEGSLRSAAKLGLGMGFSVTKEFDLMRADIDLFNGIRAENGFKPERPLVVSLMYCAETEAAARQGAQHMVGYFNDNVRHYHWSQLASIKGYEYYGGDAMKQNLDFLATSVWGTPEMCAAKIKQTFAQTGMKHLQVSAWYGEMPLEEAQRSLRLFADKVLPEL